MVRTAWPVVAAMSLLVGCSRSSGSSGPSDAAAVDPLSPFTAPMSDGSLVTVRFDMLNREYVFQVPPGSRVDPRALIQQAEQRLTESGAAIPQ